MLRVGSTGTEVEELQTFLASQGYDVGTIDGQFGPATKAALRSFQSDQGLTADGVAGPNTFKAIEEVETAVADEPVLSVPGGEDTGITLGGNAELDALLAELEADHGFTASQEDIDRWVTELESGEGRDLAGLRADIFKWRLPDADDIIDPEGQVLGDEAGEGGIPGIMAGATIHKVRNPAGQQDYYVAAYEFPPGSGHAFYYRFDSVEALELAIGPNLGGGAVPIGAVIDEDVVKQWTDGGTAAEIVGITGTFGGYIEDIITDVAAAGGALDPSLVGAALKDPGILLVMAKAAEGQWSPLQIKAALRNEDYYKDVLYPGIENFYEMSDTPEALYAMYTQNVNQTLKSLGVPPDADGSYKSQMSPLLDAGVSDVALANFAPIYKKAQTNVGYASALSEWTEKFTGTAVATFEDYFDVLAGNAPAQVQEIAEMAGLQFMADNAGFNITDQDIRNIADATDLSDEEAGQLFSRTARDLLSLGDRGLRRGGLTSDQILEAEAGIGGNVEQVKARMKKLAIEEGLVDDPTASIFTDFNREGAPIKKGLQSSIAEGA